jgi:CRP/FNR family transcriptional regulator, cyclic AMP receptor protein
MSQEAVTAPAGTVLFRQGEKSVELFYIETGCVDLLYEDSETGQEHLIGQFKGRSVLGSMSFLEDAPRSATAVATTQVSFVCVNREAREKLLHSIPQWARVLIKDLSSNLRKANAKFAKVQAQESKLKKKVERLQEELNAKKGSKEPKAAPPSDS